MRALTSVCAFAALLITVVPATAQNPVPLPTDSNLAAYMSVTGNFQSVGLGQQRNLTIRSWVAAYNPGEPIDFFKMTERAFLTLGLPEEDGWGLFVPLDGNLTVNVHITDTQNRLGRVQFRDNGTGQLLADIAANEAHSAIQGSFQNDSDVRDYVATVLSATGATLATLAVDVGKYDTVVPITFTGGFEPYTTAGLSCSHFTPAGDEIIGTIGDPTSAPGVRSGLTYVAFSRSTGFVDYINQEQTVYALSPPGSLARFVKRGVITNTINLSAFKVGDPQAFVALQNTINTASVVDPAPALGNVDVMPYADVCAWWQTEFRGQATSVLAVPFEKKRKGGLIDVLVSGIICVLQPAQDFLSILLREAGKAWLADIQHQQSSGFKQGDIMAWGDIYALVSSERAKGIKRAAPLMQDVTFELTPDIPPPNGGMGMGAVSLDGSPGYWTTVPPPGPAQGGNLSFSSSGTPPWRANLSLAKGYKWAATGSIISPLGCYEAVNQPFRFQTPYLGTVSILVTLTKLIKLQVFPENSSHNSIAGHIKLLNSSNVVIAETDTTYDPTTQKNSAIFMAVAPGSYTVKVTAPMYNEGSSGVTVQRGTLQTVTVTLSGMQWPPFP